MLARPTDSQEALGRLKCEIRLNTEERKVLQAFSFTCSELRRTKFGQQFQVASSKALRLQPNTMRSTRLSEKMDEDNWRSFLLSFRKLVMNDELENLYRTLNVLSVYGDQKDRNRIREIKRELRAVETSVAGVGILIGENTTPIKPKSVFDAMINGVLFHNDPQRESELALYRSASTFAFGAMIHYVVFTYKQALRVDIAMRRRDLL